MAANGPLVDSRLLASVIGKAAIPPAQRRVSRALEKHSDRASEFGIGIGLG